MTTPWLDDGDVRLYHGDARVVLDALPEGSVDCCITSPPYFGLRDYGVEGQIGLEDTPEAFIARLVDVFRGVARVLRPDGTCWVNLGDSYAGGGGGNYGSGLSTGSDHGQHITNVRNRARWLQDAGVKPKDLLMMPARLALALQADGWYLRSDIIWAKPNPMPESVTDRPTSAHEHVFLLTRSPRYWYDADAIRERADQPAGIAVATGQHKVHDPRGNGASSRTTLGANHGASYRNARNVWTIATQPTPDAHFATFPEALVRRCLLAGCPMHVCRVCGEARRRIVEREPCEPVYVTGKNVHNADRNDKGRTQFVGGGSTTLGWSDCGHGDYRPGVVLDPFMGSGTTAIVARANARQAVGIELSEAYLEIARKRIRARGQMALEVA